MNANRERIQIERTRKKRRRFLIRKINRIHLICVGYFLIPFNYVYRLIFSHSNAIQTQPIGAHFDAWLRDAIDKGIPREYQIIIAKTNEKHMKNTTATEHIKFETECP